jgi:DNA-binding CsgD family transcriptional regulator/tetratricopeptide (TPR) repeat protein
MPREASPAFIGRQAELERIETAWEHATFGEPQVLLVGGDAGIGKTRLLREAMSRGAEERVVVLGGCVPIAGGSLPYVPFVEILRDLTSPPQLAQLGTDALDEIPAPVRAELGRLAPALRGARSDPPPPEDPLARGRLFEAVLWLLRSWSARKPLLVAIEDLHWADGSSLDLLGYLVRNLSNERLLLLASYRTDELHRHHPLRSWIAETGRLEIVDLLEVGPLATDDLRRDIAALLNLPEDEALVERIARRADGNPLFATELVASILRGAHPGELPVTIRDGFLARLERLQPETLLIVRHVALFGRPVDAALLEASSELPADRLTAAIHEALDAQVLAVPADGDGRSFEPRHALVGETVIDDLLPIERTVLHRQIAELLEAGADSAGASDPARIAGEIAHHRWQTHATELAAAASVRAALAAADALAYSEADAHWTRVLEAWPGEPVLAGFDRPTALVEAANVAAAVGDHRRAGQLASQALTLIDARSDPMRAAEVHRRIIWYHLHIDWRSAVIHSGQAARLVPPGDPSPDVARILADRAVVMALRLHTDRAEPLARRALELAKRHHRSDAEMQALQALGNCLVSRSEHAAAIEVLTRAYELAHRLGEAEGVMNTGLALGWTLNDSGLWEAALRHCDRVDDRIRELGLALRYGAEMADHRLRALDSLGRWDELERLAETYLESNDPLVARDSLAPALLALVRVRQGRIDEARRLVSLLGPIEEVTDIEPIDWSLDPWCEIALAERNWTRARRVVETAFTRVPVRVRSSEPDLRPFVLYGLQAEAELAFEARIRRDAEAEAEALRVARDLAAWMRSLAQRVTEAREPLAATTLADAAVAEALLTRVEHRADPDAWQLALERCETVGNPYDVARARHWLAEAILDGGGSRSEAASELTLAMGTATELGAVLLERQIRDLVRRARLELGGATAGRAAIEPYAGSAPGEGARDEGARDEGEPAADVPATAAARTAGGQPGTDLVEPLTPREREVLGYVASGWTNRRIGEQLFISDKTVSVHVSNLMGKLGATNRAEAALIGDRLGLAVREDHP